MRERADHRRSGLIAVLLRTAGSLGLRILVRGARRPIDSIAMLAAVSASVVIVVNAVFLQSGSHPAPFFANPARLVTAAIVPQPKATVAPPLAARPTKEIVADIQRELSRRGFYDGPTDGVYGTKTDSALRDFAQQAGLKIATDPSEAVLQAIVQSPVRSAHAAASTPPRHDDPIADLIGPSSRITAVQRALSDYGYGQIKPTGIVDAPTSAAIEKFERTRRLPITGQISDRVVRDLAAMTGRPLE